MALDPAAATAAYIGGLGADALAKAAAYTSGSHWLLLWGLVVTAVATLIIVRSRLLERLSAKLSARGWFLRSWLIGIAFFLMYSALTLPWSIYAEWYREVGYGRTSQPLSDFLRQDAIGVGMFSVLGALFFVGVYALIRKAGRRWWLWAGGFTGAVGAFMLLISPILIEPLFNDFTPLPAGEVRDAVEVLAADADIPNDRLFVYDGSRQSNNFTANVAGVFGTARIALSDVALGEADLDEVRAVTGHEIGHYVSGHIWNLVALVAVLAMAGFFLIDRFYAAFARRLGSGAALTDPVGLPVLMLMLSIGGVLAQPIFNAVIRWGERDADNYSLEHVNLPDALASALIKTAEYRDPNPSALQEMLFYTHPSVTWRVRNAMEWKAAHPPARVINPLARPPVE